MKRTPAILRIFLIFTLLAVGLLLFAMVGRRRLPAVVSPWALESSIAERLTNRELLLRPGEQMEKVDPPYAVRVLRTAEVAGAEDAAFYLIEVAPLLAIPASEKWLADGLTFGLIDLQPAARRGELMLAAFRKIKLTKE
jgi:hypothetical protein